MEPVGALFTDLALIDVVLVPGVAFDAQGHRLGRGKGYYDRFLQSVSDIKKIGVCFDFQKVESVPAEAHDVVVDIVV
jgi:5-formyltetrahydrofolate cyclo-ligase